MKKILLLFLTILMAGINASAAVGDTFEYEGLTFQIIEESETDCPKVSVTSFVFFTHFTGDLTIPSQVPIPYASTESPRMAEVKKIGKKAFDHHSDLTTIKIPDSVIEIEDYAFTECINLISAKIPASVTKIGVNIFYDTSLENYLVDKDNAVYESIDGVIYHKDSHILVAFPPKKNIKKFTIPDSVTRIEDYAFYECTDLTSVTIPNSVTEIGKYAFNRCSSLTSLTIPASVTEIGKAAFASCYNLTSINIPDSVTKIEPYVFSSCGRLTSVIIPEFVTEIGDYAFNYCTRLTSVTIPESVTEIGGGVFYNCSGLTSVTIPGSVTIIGDRAFNCCSGLTSVTIPESVTEIGEQAFMTCSGLTSITIPESVTKIGVSTFQYCEGLTSVTIPESVTVIGEYAFAYCKGLTSVTIPASVKEIREYAFAYCKGLTSVTIPASVKEIGAYAFVLNTPNDNLKTISTYSNEPPFAKLDAFTGRNNAIVYVPKGSVEAYKAAEGWSQFEDIREMNAVELSLNCVEISIEKGESETLIATVNKGEDVTIESESWSSSNPEVATVENGVVTAVSKGDATITYSVTDNYGATHTAKCLVSVSDMTGIESVDADSDAIEAEYFNMNGIRVEKERLLPGIYIKRQGEKTTKVMVK